MPITTLDFPDQGTVLNALETSDGNNVTQLSPRDGHFILIDGFPIDLALSENHVYDSEVSDFPVESGSDITDNIRPKPITVTLEGFVSDSPLQLIRAARANAKGQPGPDASVSPSTQAYLRLLRIRRDREPVTIMTSLNFFESMALKTLSIPRASGEPHALKFHATFVQVEIITTNRAQRVAVPSAAPVVKIGWRRPGGIRAADDDDRDRLTAAIRADITNPSVASTLMTRGIPQMMAGGLLPTINSVPVANSSVLRNIQGLIGGDD